MTDEELDELTDLLATALNTEALTAWEKHFLDDIRFRVERWGTNIRMTDKQMTIIREIAER